MKPGTHIKSGFLVTAASIIKIQVAVEYSLNIAANYPVSPVGWAHLPDTGV